MASKARPPAEDAVPARLFGLVELQQIDRVALQAQKAGLKPPPHGVASVVEGRGKIAYLGRQIIGRVNAFEGVAEDLFAAALAVERGRVEVVDAQVEGALDHGDSVRDRQEAVFWASVEPGPAHGDFADLPVRFAESSVSHARSAVGVKSNGVT